MNKSRRAFPATGMAVAADHAPWGRASETNETFVDIIRPPDFVAAYVQGSGRTVMSKAAGRAQAQDVEVAAQAKQFGVARTLSQLSIRGVSGAAHLTGLPPSRSIYSGSGLQLGENSPKIME
jgi:hypothetical protein